MKVTRFLKKDESNFDPVVSSHKRDIELSIGKYFFQVLTHTMFLLQWFDTKKKKTEQ